MPVISSNEELEEMVHSIIARSGFEEGMLEWTLWGDPGEEPQEFMPEGMIHPQITLAGKGVLLPFRVKCEQKEYVVRVLVFYVKDCFAQKKILKSLRACLKETFESLGLNKQFMLPMSSLDDEEEEEELCAPKGGEKDSLRPRTFSHPQFASLTSIAENSDETVLHVLELIDECSQPRSITVGRLLAKEFGYKPMCYARLTKNMDVLGWLEHDRRGNALPLLTDAGKDYFRHLQEKVK